MDSKTHTSKMNKDDIVRLGELQKVFDSIPPRMDTTTKSLELPFYNHMIAYFVFSLVGLLLGVTLFLIKINDSAGISTNQYYEFIFCEICFFVFAAGTGGHIIYYRNNTWKQDLDLEYQRHNAQFNIDIETYVQARVRMAEQAKQTGESIVVLYGGIGFA